VASGDDRIRRAEAEAKAKKAAAENPPPLTLLRLAAIVEGAEAGSPESLVAGTTMTLSELAERGKEVALRDCFREIRRCMVAPPFVLTGDEARAKYEARRPVEHPLEALEPSPAPVVEDVSVATSSPEPGVDRPLPGESVADPAFVPAGRSYPGTAWRSKASRNADPLAPGGFSIFGSDYR